MKHKRVIQNTQNSILCLFNVEKSINLPFFRWIWKIIKIIIFWENFLFLQLKSTKNLKGTFSSWTNCSKNKVLNFFTGKILYSKIWFLMIRKIAERKFLESWIGCAFVLLIHCIFLLILILCVYVWFIIKHSRCNRN